MFPGLAWQSGGNFIPWDDSPDVLSGWITEEEDEKKKV